MNIAVFKKVYTITASANDDDYGSVSGGSTYDDGADVTLVAEPAAGCRFVRWTLSGGEVSTNASYTFAASEDATYTAEFEQIPYDIQYRSTTQRMEACLVAGRITLTILRQ